MSLIDALGIAFLVTLIASFIPFGIKTTVTTEGAGPNDPVKRSVKTESITLWMLLREWWHGR